MKHNWESTQTEIIKLEGSLHELYSVLTQHQSRLATHTDTMATLTWGIHHFKESLKGNELKQYPSQSLLPPHADARIPGSNIGNEMNKLIQKIEDIPPQRTANIFLAGFRQALEDYKNEK
jgi:hypothetical protein